MAQLEHMEAIEKRLWIAADTLRANSNYASNEYFLPAMGLIFLRHAYSRFLGVKDEIEANLGIKRDTVYKWIARKQIPAHRMGRPWKSRKGLPAPGSSRQPGDDTLPTSLTAENDLWEIRE